jgi:Spy/CpxP family protein refolding chaperone
MSKIKLLGIAVIGLLLLNFGILGMMFFQPRAEGPGHPPHKRPREIIIERLKLDDEQQEQYEHLIHRHRSAVDSLNERSKKAKTELYSLLNEPFGDSLRSSALLNEIANIQKETEKVNFAHFREIRQLCRPEQIPMFNELIAELSTLFGPPRPPHRPHREN